MSVHLSFFSDRGLLFLARGSRMFAYGLLSVVLVLYLVEKGLDEWQVGLLLSLTLVGDTVLSLILTTTADRIGRRVTLIAGAVLMALAAGVFLSTDQFGLLLAAATIGIISPSGNEIGPFLSVEQASLAQLVTDDRRTDLFAWYHLVGSFATAFGALAAGVIVAMARDQGLAGAAAYHPVLVVYGLIALGMILCFACVSSAVEVTRTLSETAPKKILGLHRSRRKVLYLSLLFALDALGGGFVLQSLLAYWFSITYQLDPVALGTVFWVANLLAGVSALAAGRLARRIGLLNTMIFTHLPSNILLILVPLMPNAGWAIGMLLARFSISQMDVPTRQAYTMAVVAPDERSAAAGITGVARSIGASLSPAAAAALMGTAGWASVPFFLAGGLKITYDLLLYRAFVTSRTGIDTSNP